MFPIFSNVTGTGSRGWAHRNSGDSHLLGHLARLPDDTWHREKCQDETYFIWIFYQSSFISLCQMLVFRCISCWQLIQTQWLLWRENIKSKLLLISPVLLFQYCREQADPWPLARLWKLTKWSPPSPPLMQSSELVTSYNVNTATSHSYTIVNTKLSNKIQRKNDQNEWNSHTSTTKSGFGRGRIYLLCVIRGKYKCENFHKIVAASLSGQAAKVELFPFIATRSQLQRSQVIRELHEMLHCWLAGGGRGNHCRTVSTDIWNEELP